MSEDFRVCHSHTAARRHRTVLGNWHGIRIPPSNGTQIGIVLASLALLALLHSLWMPFAPGLLKAGVIMGVPWFLWWKTRDLVPDGRQPHQWARAWTEYAIRPRSGRADMPRTPLLPVLVDDRGVWGKRR